MDTLLRSTLYTNSRKLLKYCSVISRVVRCKSKVKFLDLRDYCRYIQYFQIYIRTLLTSWQEYTAQREIYLRDLHVFIVETWPWVLFGESLHRCINILV